MSVGEVNERGFLLQKDLYIVQSGEKLLTHVDDLKPTLTGAGTKNTPIFPCPAHGLLSHHAILENSSNGLTPPRRFEKSFLF